MCDTASHLFPIYVKTGAAPPTTELTISKHMRSYTSAEKPLILKEMDMNNKHATSSAY